MGNICGNPDDAKSAGSVTIKKGSITMLETKEQFEAFIKENPKCIIDAFATWCPPCKAIAPKYEALSLSKEYLYCAFGKFDTDILKECPA